MNKSRNSLLMVIPCAIVFTSSFCIMVLELVAARLIARHLGSSLYTWTAVIGVVLAGITIGNYLGGRIADRFHVRKALSLLFALSSAACVLTVVLNNVVGEWLWLWRLSWPVRVFAHVSLVFLVPSTLLGTISPVIAKMALDRGLPTGRTVGDIYAWGAAGSIAGTFATGYYLIMAMGTVSIIWTVGGVLLVMALLCRMRFWPLHAWVVLFIIILVTAVAPMQWCQTAGAALKLREQPDPKVLFRGESQYCHIIVRQISEHPDRRVFIQDKFRDSDIIMGDVNNLQYFYTQVFAAVTKGLSGDKERLNVLSIGGGGYVFPRYVETHWPGSRIDVAEIDPLVTEAATQAFGLSRDTTINTIHLDARNYIDRLLQEERNGRSAVRYDFIYEDAFNDYAVPYQLVTREFNDKVFKMLTDGGVYVINMIDVYDSGLFLGAYINTLESTFPFVCVLSQAGAPKSIRLTFLIVASKQQLDMPALIQAYRDDLDVWHLTASEIELVKRKAGDVLLTDDYAPVENMLAAVVRQSANEMLGWKYYDQAGDLAGESRFRESIAAYEKAAKANPQMMVMAYNQIGLIHAQLGDLANSIRAFETAIEYNERAPEKADIGSVHFNLGVAQQRRNRAAEAAAQMKKAVACFREEIKKSPDSGELYTRMGDALASLGDFKAASEAFRQAVKLDPQFPASYFNLARALEFQGLYDEAIAVMQEGVSYMRKTGRADAAAQLLGYLGDIKTKKAQQNR